MACGGDVLVGILCSGDTSPEIDRLCASNGMLLSVIGVRGRLSAAEGADCSDCIGEESKLNGGSCIEPLPEVPGVGADCWGSSAAT